MPEEADDPEENERRHASKCSLSLRQESVEGQLNWIDSLFTDTL